MPLPMLAKAVGKKYGKRRGLKKITRARGK